MDLRETWESALLSTDSIIRDFATFALDRTTIPTAHTLNQVLQSEYVDELVPHIQYMPFDETSIDLIIKRIKSAPPETSFHYQFLLLKAPVELLLKNKKKLKGLLQPSLFELLEDLKAAPDKSLWEDFGMVLAELEKEFNPELHLYGKKVVDELFFRNDLTTAEIDIVLEENIEQHFFNYDAIYYLYISKKMKYEGSLPALLHVMRNPKEGDLVLEEACHALIQLGNDKVVTEIEKIALQENSPHCIDVLAKIRTETAEKALLRLFQQSNDRSEQTLIADALCQHLSIEAIPKVENLINEGFDKSILDLEESLYTNLVLNNIDKPYLNDMKRSIDKEQSRTKQILDQHFEQPVTSQKIGRNEPCPCGSGKKYKKCCMA